MKRAYPLIACLVLLTRAIPLPAPANAVASGQLDAHKTIDLAVLAGRRVSEFGSFILCAFLCALCGVASSTCE
jgi:hypothetical protein